jgi:hypothetical protein
MSSHKCFEDGLLYLLTDEADAVMLRIEPAE